MSEKIKINETINLNRGKNSDKCFGLDQSKKSKIMADFFKEITSFSNKEDPFNLILELEYHAAKLLVEKVIKKEVPLGFVFSCATKKILKDVNSVCGELLTGGIQEGFK